MRLLSFFVFLIVLGISVIWMKSSQNDYQVLRGYTFGTYYVVKVRSPRTIKNFAALVDEQFDKVNQHLSVFEKKSELSALNDAPDNQWVPVSADLFYLLQKSQKIHALSGGYFDPSVAPLIELWGFGKNKNPTVPTAKELANVLKNVGFDKLLLKEPNLVMKEKKQLSLNLSAIAKGYAVDLVADALKNKGYEDFLVDIGGEIYAAGSRNEENEPWNVGIGTPSETNYDNSLAVSISNLAVATSGNYRNFHYINGKRYAHTIDPKTGLPTEGDLLSVSVFAPTCTEADAFATAMMSMGEKKALAFADENKLAVIFFVADDSQSFKIVYSQTAHEMLEN